MLCQACERGDHDNCGMQTWCSCDCEGWPGIYLPDDPQVFTNCNVCGGPLPKDDRMGMCDRCAMESL